ncbi:MAG: phage terminase large subunit family protein [Pseudomonadota bacterium]|nr:phage terminase large subunit family protein [Pseudomonadota bacterium]
MIENYKSLLTEISIEYPLIGQALLHHKNTRNQPMSFKDMPYLAQMYAELPKCEGADIRKAVQTGLSELFIALSLYHAGWKGKIVAYILPTFSVRDRFVSSRINKILLNSEEYRKHLPNQKDVGNNRMKRFGSGSILFLGSNTTGDFVEFSADTVIVDEFDQCDPANLAKAKDRIRASKDPRMYRLGNPTLPNTGICALFDESDQRFWFCRCTHCGHWQNIDWLESIVMKDDNENWVPRDPIARQLLKDTRPKNLKYKMKPVCIKCNEPFDRNNEGEWVAKYKERERRGYTMSRLDVLSQSYTDLYVEWLDSQDDINKLSTFYTSVLGQGFEYSGARIGIEMLYDCATGEELDYAGGGEYKEEIVSMGVDVGSVLNVVISTAKEDEEGNLTRNTVLVCAVRKFEELKSLIKRFNVTCCTIDAMPETRKTQELRDWGKSLGVMIWMCRFYPTPRFGKEAYGRKLNWKDRVVTVDRTQILDATFDEIKHKKRTLPKDVFTVLGFKGQMKAPVRILDQSRGRIVWVSGNNPDHYRFADVYDRIAFDMTQMGASYSAI